MKGFLIIIFIVFTKTLIGQQYTSQLWLATGCKFPIYKNLTGGIDITERFGTNGLATIFPQGSVKYKLTKWLRPSIDYRFISSKEINGIYTNSHRLNSNLQFNYLKKRLDIGFRIRYQYSFSNIGQGYDSEFDNAWRFKPSISYDFNDFILSPTISADFFYNPANAANGNQFTRVRYFLGVDLDLNSPHGFELGYYFDQNINEANPIQKNIVSIGYTYSIGSTETKKEKKTYQKDIRDF